MRHKPHKLYPGALLAQECCSYQGSTELLAKVRGRLLVLVHSDRDCSNVLPKTRDFVRSELDYKFFCTNLKEDELVTGQGNKKLRRAIELLHEAYAPELIVVLSTCPTVMIGDNTKNVSRKASKDLGVKVAAQITHGLKTKSPAEVVDVVYTLLSKSADPAPEGDDERSRRVNLVGMELRADERKEIRQLLEAMGLEVNAIINSRSSLEDFQRLGRAAFNVHPGPNMLIDFDARALEALDQRAIEVPLPYGLSATDTFYARIAEATGVPGERLQSARQALRDDAEDAVNGFKRKNAERLASERGLRVAYNIGSVRSFDLRRIALEELGERPFFSDLGFGCKLFIQGPQQEENVVRTGEILKQLHNDDDYVVFNAPGRLDHFLSPGEFDLFYGTDFMRNQLSRARLAFLDHNMLQCGYSHVRRNVELVQATIDSRFYELFAGVEEAPFEAPEQHVSG